MFNIWMLCFEVILRPVTSPPTIAQHVTLTPLSVDDWEILVRFYLYVLLPKIDYCNSLLCGSQMYVLERLQKVQNSAARLIFQCCKQNHISPLLMYVHWLPINVYIEYKLSVICHSFFISLSPIYFSDLLSVYTPKRNLRSSSDNGILCIPKLWTKSFGHRSFSFAAPQYLILCLQNSDILILSRNVSQH